MNAVHIFPQPSATRHVHTRFDARANNTLWITLPESIDGRPPYYSPALLDDLTILLESIQEVRRSELSITSRHH